MREIKFRAWDRVNNKFLSEEDIMIDANGQLLHNEACMRKNDDYELMQYTGLTDKNGNEIYEGDILKTREGVGTVYYEAPSFSVTNEYQQVFSACHHDFEIIGNIHENLELLEVNK